MLKQRDVGKKDVASSLVKEAPRPPGLGITLKNRLNKFEDRPEPKDDNTNLSPTPSPPPRPPTSPPQPPSSFPQSRPLTPPFIPLLLERFL